MEVRTADSKPFASKVDLHNSVEVFDKRDNI